MVFITEKQNSSNLSSRPGHDYELALYHIRINEFKGKKSATPQNKTTGL